MSSSSQLKARALAASLGLAVGAVSKGEFGGGPGGVQGSYARSVGSVASLLGTGSLLGADGNEGPSVECVVVSGGGVSGGEWTFNVCGGMIGTQRAKFCCDPPKGGMDHCGIPSHNRIKATLQDGYAYIRCAGQRGTSASAAYVDPSVNHKVLPAAFQETFNGSMTVGGWSRFFAVLPTPEEIADEVVQDKEVLTIMHQASKPASFAFTPSKRKSKFEGDEGLNVRFETQASRDTLATLSKIFDIEAVTMTLGSELDEAKSMLPQWNYLIETVGRLVESVEVITADMREKEDFLERLSLSLESKVVSLAGLVGQRPITGMSDRGPNLWSSMKHVCDELDNINSTVTSSNTQSKNTEFKISECYRRVMDSETKLDEIITKMEKTQALTGLIYEQVFEGGGDDRMVPDNIGGDQRSFDFRFQELETQLNNLQLTVASNRTGIYQGPSSTGDTMTTALLERLVLLEQDNATIKASLGGDVVKINGEPYHSAEELESWILKNVGTEAACDVWFDVVSMLESLQDTTRSSDETMESQGLARQGGYDSLADGRIINSFSVSIPEVFRNKASKDSFSKIDSFNSWDRGDGRTGLVPNLRKTIKNWESRQLHAINQRFGGAQKAGALNLAMGLMTSSLTFWESLVTWVNQFFHRLTSKTDTGGRGDTMAERREYEASVKDVMDEAWFLILKVMEDIFQELSARRAEGVTAIDVRGEPVRKSAIILYATLRAHKFMDELRLKSFEKHPVMSPTFNGFLFTERASKSDIKRVEMKIVAVEKQAHAVQAKVDKAYAGGGGKQKG